MRITCNVDRTVQKTKPTVAETRNIQARLTTPEELDVRELATIVTGGGTFRVSANSGSMDKCGFKSSQLLVFDCDNSLKVNGETLYADNPFTPEDVRRVLDEIGVHTTFQYYSQNHGIAPVPKFRTVSVLSEPITDGDLHERVVRFCADRFDKFHCDRNALRCCNIFYGAYGKGGPVYENYDAVTDTGALIEMVTATTAPTPETRQNVTRRARRTTGGLYGNEPNRRVIEAIRTHNSQYLRRKIGNKRRTFDTKEELMSFIYREIDLADFLEVDAHKAFRCVLPDHEDRHPSASVFRSTHGVWLYKCFVCGKRNIKQLIEEIAEFSSEFAAIAFICEVFNLKVRRTKWSEEQTENIDRILTAITSADGEDAFSTICPTAAKVTRHAQATYIQILILAKSTIYPEKTGDGQIVFYLSIPKIAAAAGKTSLGMVHNHVKQLVYCHMLDVLEDDEIPPAILKKAMESAGDGKKRTSVFRIPSWVVKQCRKIEDSGKKWREYGYRVKGISYEMFYRNEPDEAKRLYPDSKHRTLKSGEVIERTTTPAADARHMELAMFVTENVEKYGYCTEKSAVIFAKNKTLAERQIARSMTDICNSYGYKKCRCNKALKALYHIESNGYPMIIVRD